MQKWPFWGDFGVKVDQNAAKEITIWQMLKVSQIPSWDDDD